MSNKQPSYGQEGTDYSSNKSQDSSNKQNRDNTDFSSAARAGADKLKSISGNIKDSVKRTYDQAESAVEDFGENLTERGRKMSRQVNDVVQNNPWAVIGCTAVAAIAIGFLVGRRNSSMI
jgi:ElaB/YqjD/DUF883 family membrane-anchored ribosome-binding protein